MEIPNMEILTQSGSRYSIKNNLCVKKNSRGVIVDTFKIYSIKDITEEILSMEEIYQSPESLPTVGHRMFISGRDTWWVSTVIVEIKLLVEDLT